MTYQTFPQQQKIYKMGKEKKNPEEMTKITEDFMQLYFIIKKVKVIN